MKGSEVVMAFLDYPSGKAECEESLKVMWKYTLLTNISSL